MHFPVHGARFWLSTENSLGSKPRFGRTTDLPELCDVCAANSRIMKRKAKINSIFMMHNTLLESGIRFPSKVRPKSLNAAQSNLSSDNVELCDKASICAYLVIFPFRQSPIIQCAALQEIATVVKGQNHESANVTIARSRRLWARNQLSVPFVQSGVNEQKDRLREPIADWFACSSHDWSVDSLCDWSPKSVSCGRATTGLVKFAGAKITLDRAYG